jgi:hypothetical protein
MTRKPPPRKGRKAPARQKTQVKHSTTIRKGNRGRVVHHEDKVEKVEVSIEPGDESIGVGYDVKFWASAETGGMTIGASAYVKLSCRPSEIDLANDTAADLAWKFMHRNAQRARREINNFIKDE